jgi:hypothetical protein
MRAALLFSSIGTTAEIFAAVWRTGAVGTSFRSHVQKHLAIGNIISLEFQISFLNQP